MVTGVMNMANNTTIRLSVLDNQNNEIAVKYFEPTTKDRSYKETYSRENGVERWNRYDHDGRRVGFTEHRHLIRLE